MFDIFVQLLIILFEYVIFFVEKIPRKDFFNYFCNEVVFYE